MADTKIIAVLGAGLMGHGIALTFANAGHDVRVYDPLPSSLEVLPGRVLASLEAMGYTRPEIDATLSRITAKAGLPACVSGADFVFEAAPEKPDLKRSLFKARSSPPTPPSFRSPPSWRTWMTGPGRSELIGGTRRT